MKCPTCGKELTPDPSADGVTRYSCDCIGFRRTVIEQIPSDVPNPAAPDKEKKTK
jgi:hypothetical protein